jgi:hypothetical protein
MAYVDFEGSLEGQKKRKKFWLSEEGLILITGWRRNGVSIKEIATSHIGVSMTAFWGWYRESDELKKACATGKDIADRSVEDALYRRALGYDYNEYVYELIEGELRLTKKFTKHCPPDVKAILSWLYNRVPNVWRSIQEPLEATQYTETIKNILVAMKEVANGSDPKEIETAEVDRTE